MLSLLARLVRLYQFWIAASKCSNRTQAKQPRLSPTLGTCSRPTGPGSAVEGVDVEAALYLPMDQEAQLLRMHTATSNDNAPLRVKAVYRAVSSMTASSLCQQCTQVTALSTKTSNGDNDLMENLLVWPTPANHSDYSNSSPS